MLIDMKVSGKRVLVVGGGRVGERKTASLLREGADVTVVSDRFTERLTDLSKEGRIKIERVGRGACTEIIKMLSDSNFIIAATDDRELNRRLAEQARASKIPICVVDNPEICDFHFPATADFGSLKIAVSTGGRSPVMADILRRKLERSITEEDILKIELQSYARSLLRSGGVDKAARRRILYNIIKDRKISNLLRGGRLEEAKEVARGIIRKA
ncbi:bifunctional precorrin-2 dehydrogenase/sirohydrochlorin ferrochelatase [Candidatus Bathyarchaeota archaeon]|nr:bifunctional precorrin-2 dehydrogenase/sirohydrochlorin ferrochelatase [Candidatus Bathyarchaeota archaeon]